MILDRPIYRQQAGALSPAGSSGDLYRMVDGVAEYIGRKGAIKIGGFTIPVIIRDARNAYGRIDVKIEAIGAKGEKWVNLGKVELNDDK